MKHIHQILNYQTQRIENGEKGENKKQTQEGLINDSDITDIITNQPDKILNIYEAVPVTTTATPKVIEIMYTTEFIVEETDELSQRALKESVDQSNTKHVFPEIGNIQEHINDKNSIVPNRYKHKIRFIRQKDNFAENSRQKEISLQQNTTLSTKN